MAQLAVSFAGAAVGFAIGGPVGAQIGWVAGSLLGASLGPGSQGPRLEDKKVQISSYGSALPIVYGGVRIAGNVIWSTDLQESSSDSGGKGGPSVTTFAYSASFAVALCEGVQAGVRRIWADAKLVYDISDGADVATQAASTAFAEYFTFYTGSEIQDPDPTIEAAEGAGDVEAYRGVCYLVFTDLPLDNYGNRIPNISVELSTEAPVDATADVLANLRLGPWEDTGSAAKPKHSEALTTYRYPSVGTVVYEGTDIAAAEAAMQAAYPWATQYLGYYTSRNNILSMFTAVGETGADQDIDDDQGARYVYLAYNVEVPANVDASLGYGDGTSDQQWCTGVSSVTGCATSGPTESVMSTFFPEGIGGGGASVGHGGLGRMFPYPGPVSGDGYDEYALTALDNVLGANCVSCPPNGAGYYPVVKVIKHRFIRVERTLSMPAQTCEIGDPVELGIAQVPGNSTLCIAANGTLSANVAYSAASGNYKQLRELEQDTTEVIEYPLGPVLLSGSASDTQVYWEAQAALAGVTGTYGVDFPVAVTDVAAGSNSAMALDAGSVLLSDIVTDVCERAGLSSGQIDVTALTDEVQGYKVTRQAPARAALEPLRQAFFFDAVENGDEIVFVKRGGASAVTIAADELGAAESQQPEPLVTPTRAQETELPAEVSVAYEVREADYQTGTQRAMRVTTGSQQKVGVELPIVMTDEKGAEVADVLMVDAWQGRSERAFSTTRKYTKYLPTDVVTVDDGEFTYVGRITEKLEDGPVIRWKMRDTATATYTSNATGAPTSGGGGAIVFVPPVRTLLLDVPALRDDDDDAGFYAAAAPYGGVFPGSGLYKSVDALSYSLLQAMNVAAVMGYASTVLPDFNGGNVIDECSTVTVVTYGGELSTISRSALLAGGNACVIGDEVLQFLRATLTATNTYRLTGLLRGRRGTEQHMGTHTASDRFCMLNEATVYRVAQSIGQVGTAYYKGVPAGVSVVDVPAVEFENTGAALKPLSPVHLAAAPVPGSATDYAVQWVRRTRIGGAWSDYVDAPLSEASESYSVEVLSGGSVISTTAVTSPSATVTADPADVVRVYQVSALIGRGFPAEITLT